MTDQIALWQGMTPDAKRAEVETCTSIADLDSMWSAWEMRGFSPEGQMRARILIRKGELGHELTSRESELVDRIVTSANEGSALPPIGGVSGK